MPLVFVRIVLLSSCQTILNQCSSFYSGDTIEQSISHWLLCLILTEQLFFFSIKEEKVPLCPPPCDFNTGSLPCYLSLTLKNTNSLVLHSRASIWRRLGVELLHWWDGWSQTPFATLSYLGAKTQLISLSKMSISCPVSWVCRVMACPHSTQKELPSKTQIPRKAAH